MYIIFIHFFPSSCDKESMLQILRVCEGGWKCSHFFVWDWEKKRAVFQMSAKWNEFVSVCEREWKLPNMIRVSGGKSSNFRKWRTKSHIPEFDVWERRKCAPDYTGRVVGRGRLFQSDYCLGTRQASLPPNSARFSYATEGALYLRVAVQRRGQRPPRGLGTDMTKSNLAPKHARKHETSNSGKKRKKGVPSGFKRFWFYLCWCNLCWRL